MEKLELVTVIVEYKGRCDGACRYGASFPRNVAVIDQMNSPRKVTCAALNGENGTCEPKDFFGDTALYPKPHKTHSCSVLIQRI